MLCGIGRGALTQFPPTPQVGVRGKDVVVRGVEKKSVSKLQEDRTVRKICLIDDHVVMAFAGEPVNLSTFVPSLWS